MRRCVLVALACLWASPGLAQQAKPASIAVDSAVAFDEAIDQNGDAVPGVTIDTIMSAGLGRGFEAIVRPWVQRLGSTREWNRQVWLATLRYERTGRVDLRVDGGLIPPPVGYANMFLRATANPTIAMPSSLFTPLPTVETGAPRATLLGNVYPYGVNATVSRTWWDVRGAVMDTSPLRVRRVFAQANPPQFTNVLLGGGITPIVGLRVGTSVTHGGWRKASEIAAVPHDEAEEAAEYAEYEEYESHEASGPSTDATVITIESEYAFRYSKVAGEWVRNARETNNGEAVATGWFVQGQQTLTPRWFAAARLERMTAPALVANAFVTQRFTGVESIAGYRLTPDVTLRAGYRAREGFGRPAFAHAATFSVVWWARWK